MMLERWCSSSFSDQDQDRRPCLLLCEQQHHPQDHGGGEEASADAMEENVFLPFGFPSPMKQAPSLVPRRHVPYVRTVEAVEHW